MKRWLDNVTDEQIKNFIRQKDKYDEIEIERGKEVIVIKTMSFSNNREQTTNQHIYYYNAFGKGYIYRNQFILEPFNTGDMGWFNMVKHANTDDEIGYYTELIHAHENAMIHEMCIKNTIIAKKISELTSITQANEEKVYKERKRICQEINKLKNKTNIKNSDDDISLIVKDILSKMPYVKSGESLKENGGILECSI